MEQKQTFFASLEPRSALAVGVVGGFLVLCTIGFFVMLGINLKGGKQTAVNTNAEQVAANTANDTQTPPPVVPKTDKPKVELFVMSYCPFGLQMQKAYLPAWDLLKNKADISIKFVSYAMHGKKEIDENTRQYCIQKNFPAKYSSYLKCFVGEDNYKKCLSTAGLTEGQLSSCVSSADKQFKISANFNDQSTWLSGRYPIYSVDQDLNDKYQVQGSPTLVINGVQAETNRTPEAVKQAICAAYNNQPAECKQALSTASFSSGFGMEASSGGASAECGG